VLVGFLSCQDITPTVESTRQALGVVTHLGSDKSRGGGVFACDTPDAASDFIVVLLRHAHEPVVVCRELFPNPLTRSFFPLSPNCGTWARAVDANGNAELVGFFEHRFHA
jgi:hypothetical protein